MEQKNINYVVLAFVFLIIGSLLIGQVASNVNDRTDKSKVFDEADNLVTTGCIVAATSGGQINGTDDADCNITVTYAPTGWKLYDSNSCPLTNVVVTNASGTVFTAGTDYNLFASTGIIQMLNTTATQSGFANSTLIDYTYCGDDYLNSTWGRSVLDTTVGFFALALLGISLWLFYSVFQSVGILNKR